MYGIKIGDKRGNEKPIYAIGDTISLMLQMDAEDIELIGENIAIQVKDPYDNIIASLVANKINDVYLAEWTIPLYVHKLYNSGIQDDGEFYLLSDKWVFPDSTELSFEFLVEKTIEEPVAGNCEYSVTINGVSSDNGDLSDSHSFIFTSNLTPYYSSINDVRTVMEEELSVVSDFDIAREIMNFSRQVDLHMKPEKVHLQEQYDFAVRMYVRYAVAKSKLMFLLAINAESKELDTLKYSKNSSGDPAKSLVYLEDLMAKYSNIILAGGKDTPFTTKTFAKGVLDPNRPSANRGGLDTSDPYPWVNTTTSNSLININGSLVELRGTRTVAFLRNRSSYPNIYLRSEGIS